MVVLDGSLALAAGLLFFVACRRWFDRTEEPGAATPSAIARMVAGTVAAPGGVVALWLLDPLLAGRSAAQVIALAAIAAAVLAAAAACLRLPGRSRRRHGAAAEKLSQRSMSPLS